MSERRGYKRSNYKQWLYDSSQTKPKVTKWREEKKNVCLSTDLNEEDSAWIDDDLVLGEIDNAQCSHPQFDLNFDECSSCITTTSQNRDVDIESVVTSATSDFNFDDDDSLTKMPGSIMETEQR